MSFILYVMEDKDSFDFHGHSDGILLLLIKCVYCLEKWELKISIFSLKSVIGGITCIFLFRNVFNLDQCVLGLVLGYKNLFATFA